MSPGGRTNGSENQGVEADVAPLVDFVLPVPLSLISVEVEVLVSKVGAPLPGNTAGFPLNYKFQLCPGSNGQKGSHRTDKG